jgi:hypothetical protein
MIAGLNVEITNRLTLSRRPGNPQYDSTNQYTDVLAFDEFRYSKALSDIWGTEIEQIDVMVDTAAALYADTNANTKTLVWTKTAGAGQSFMQEVGSQLYFGNGIDQKKWDQSLFERNSGNNSSVLNIDAYPFMDTYLISNPSSNPQIQQLIGVQLASITGVTVTDNVLTLTLSAPLGTGYDATPAGGDQAIGTQFILWNFPYGSAASFLNGATIALTVQYTGGDTLTAAYTEPNMSESGLSGILQVADGVTSGITDKIGDVTITSVPTSGSTVPNWGTVAPAVGNNFQGSITVDGNLIWVNRGTTVENWGIAAPTADLDYTASGSSQGWAPNTYYSIGSIYQDSNGYLWQISTPGIVGATIPNFTGATPTVQYKFDIDSWSITTNVVTFETSAQTLVPGNVVTIAFMGPGAFMNSNVSNQTYIVLTATGTSFTAAFTNGNVASTKDEGIGILAANAANPTTTITDGAAVWTAIQTPTQTNAWQPSHHYFQGDFLKGTPAASTASYFQLQKNGQNFYPTPQPHLSEAVAVDFYGTDHGGEFTQYYPAGSPTSTFTPASLNWATAGYPANTTSPLLAYAINGAAAVGAGVSTGHNYGQFAIVTKLFIPAAGSYTFTLTTNDGGFFSFDDVTTSAYKLIGTFTEAADLASDPHTTTAVQGYGSGPSRSGTGQNLVGTNQQATTSAHQWVSTATWNFPAPGEYGLEIDYSNWAGNGGSGTSGEMVFTCNSQQVAITPDESGTIQPSWPTFTTTGATWNAQQMEIIFGTGDIVQESGNQYTWVNIGPVSNFAWTPNLDYTLPMTNIVDSNGNEEGAISTGFSGTTAPKWNTNLNGITLDNGTLAWINEGPIPITPTEAGKITATSAQGWIYAIALVNTLDNTVSNIGPLSAATGPLVNGEVTFAPGAGLIPSAIDPQSDYVAIFRTTDGFSTELLIPGFGNTIYTVPLVQYLTYGYVDDTPDLGLDSQAEAPADFENTPPLPGAANLTYHLNRIFYSIGNTVFWTSGPDDPIGNGINGFGPNNFDKMPSIVKRLVPTAIGLLVFTVSDIYIIPTGPNASPQPSYVWAAGIGISSYNALDWNGPTIGFFTTDSQFLTLSPNAGMAIESVPLADQFSLRNGTPGQNWVPQNVYVANYVSGQDMGWFISDGEYGWFRLINNPTPENGSMSWSPFANIAGGVGAIKSVETSPGVHHLLLGPLGTGYILNRNVLASTDGGTTITNGTTYPAYAVFGSYVLAQPGQVAQVSFITTKSVNTGSPLVLGLLIDEGLPYYTGSFEILKRWVNDPPDLKPSKSWYTQRFYLSDMIDTAAACTDIQIMVQWPSEGAINELQSFTIFGSFVQEQ